MYIGLLKFNNIKSKILVLVILGALAVAIVLIGITVYKMVNDENVKIGITTKINIFDIKKYKYLANVKIYGNKTINNYSIEEEYEENAGNYNFKINTKSDENEVSYIIENNNMKIFSNSQISEYVLSEYMVKKTNVLSISTFISLYNNVEEYIKNNSDTGDVKIEIENIENKTCYRIIINNTKLENLKDYKEILADGVELNKFELFISNDTNIPIEYIVYNKNGDAYIDMQYTLFSL